MSEAADAIADSQPGGAVLVVAIARATRFAAICILLLGVGSIATQAVAIATGREFLFGLVPKLNAAGPRSIPVWLASSALAAWGAVALLAAATFGAQHRKLSTSWAWLAAAIVVLSADRLAPIGRGFYFLLGDIDPHVAGAVASAVAAAAAMGLYARCVANLPRTGKFHFVTPVAVFALGVSVCAVATAGALSSPDDRLGQALVVAAGRILELSGLTLALGEILALVRSQSSRMYLRVDSRATRLLAARQHTGRVDITVSPAAVSRAVVTTIVVLLLVSLVSAVGRTLLGWNIERFYRVFYVDFEGNIPTWFSSFLLFSCGTVLAAIAAATRARAAADWKQWAMLAALFLVLSADEAASFHEMTVAPLRHLLGENPWLRYPLIIPGSMAAATIALVFGAFLRQLPRDTRVVLYAGGALFLFGALVLETMGGWYDPVVHGNSLVYILLATVEEGCEFAGAGLFLHGLIRHVEAAIGPIEISVRP